MGQKKSFSYLINKFGRSQHLLAAALLLVILAIFYGDVVFYHRTFLMETAAPGTMPHAGPYNYKGIRAGFVVNDPGAIAWQIEPFNRFISTSVKKGDFPLWNPYAGLAGSPLLADGHTGPLEPIQFVFFFLPDRFWPLAIDFQLLIRFFIAGFGCHLFARRQGISFWGSVSAGSMFMLSSYFVTYGNHPQVKTEVLLPLVLYGYDRLVDHQDRPGLWFCALFIGWAIIAAMPESTFFALFLGTLWYFCKSILLRQENGWDFQKTKKLILRFFGSTAIGFFVSAAYLLPFLEFVSVAKSIHAPGANDPIYALQLLPGLIFQIHTKFFLHIGFFAIFSLIFSLLNFNTWLRYRQHIVFFSLYALIFLSILFGFPLTNWIRNLPIFNQLILGKYPIPSIVFCVAVLTGILIDSIRDLPLSYNKLTYALLILTIVFVGIPRIKNLESVSNYSSDLEFIHRALALMICISVILYLVAFYQRSFWFRPHMVQLSFLIIIMLEPFFWSIRINRPERFDPFQIPPFISYLSKKNDFRIFGLDGTLYPNISTAYHISDVRWLQALAIQRAYDFSTSFIESNEVRTLRLTGTILPISDKMFSLLNVKYILKENSSIRDAEHCLSTKEDQPYFGKDTLNPSIFQQNQGKKNFFPQLPININGATRLGIFAQSPQKLTLSLSVPKDTSKLDFSIGLNPEVFLPARGDGVTFRIVLSEQSKSVEIFSKYIDPKNRPCDRKWFDESINLEKWAGKNVILKLITNGGPSGDNSYDWAYWGDIHFATTPGSRIVQEEMTDSPYNLVYQDQDVLIYQNKDALPRASMMYSIANVSNFSDSLVQLTNPNIDLRKTAVVENLPAGLKNIINQNNQQIQSMRVPISLIRSGELSIKVSTSSPGLLVVRDQYYPGWKAYVNGKPTPIYAVDGIFRGIFLGRGEHMVEFKYCPLSFIIGGILSSISLLTAVVCLFFYSHSKQNHHD